MLRRLSTFVPYSGPIGRAFQASILRTTRWLSTGSPSSSLICEPEWLKSNLDKPNVRIIDCSVLEAYRRAHIPHAVRLHAHYYLKEPNTRHIVQPSTFAQLVSELGIQRDHTVVAYDDNNSLLASRLWWVFRYYGFEDVRILHGGWHNWLSHEYPASFHSTRVELTPLQDWHVNLNRVATLDEVEEIAETDPDSRDSVLIDVRSIGEWTGETRYGPRGGRIAGARRMEWTDVVTKDDKRQFLPESDLLTHVQQSLGLKDPKEEKRTLITYCEAGVRAAHTAFTLEHMGYRNVKVFDGSMAEYSRSEGPLEVDE